MTCHNCPYDRADRAEMSCGLLPAAERSGEFVAPDEWGMAVSVCPGYSTSLPQVEEVSRAHWWMEQGYLAERYEGEALTPQLMDAIEIYALEASKVRAFAAPKPKGRDS